MCMNSAVSSHFSGSICQIHSGPDYSPGDTGALQPSLGQITSSISHHTRQMDISMLYLACSIEPVGLIDRGLFIAEK